MRCIALDDEPIALALVSSFIKRTAGLELTGAYNDPRAAMEQLRMAPCDLLFLDLHMPYLHGFEVLKQLAAPPLTIVTTAHDQHAVKSYDLEVVDYVLKPFSYDRFLAAVERAKLRASIRDFGAITLRSGTGVVRVPVSDITHVEAFDDYVKVHRTGQRPVVALSTMKSIEGALPGARFLRIHRSFIVQWDKVSQLKDRRLWVDGVELPVGDTYWQLVRSRLSDEQAG
jgi:two-component system, LytTR family, response regulator